MKRLIYISLFFIFIPASNAQESDDLYCKGAAYMQMGRYDEAINYLTSAIKLSPGSARLYFKRGKAYYKSDSLNKAMRDFQETNALNESLADLWISKTYARLGNNDESLSYLKSHLKSGYRMNEKVIRKDDAYNDLQYSDEWYMLWQGNWYTNEEETIKEVDYMVKKEMYLDALVLLDEKIPESKYAYKLHACRAKVNEKLNNYKGAVEDWSIAISIENRIIKYYVERGNAYFELGKFKDAINDFTKALRQEPAEFTLYIKRAKAYAKLKEYKPALRDVVTYLKYFEHDQEAIALCGNLHYLNENYIEALKYFNKNLSLDKSNPEYYKDRGRTYLKSKTYKYAISDLSMALDLSPNDGETYFLLGIACFETEDMEGACYNWKEAKKKGDYRAIEYLLEHCE